MLTTLDSLYVGHCDCTIRVFLLSTTFSFYCSLITIVNSNTL